MRNKILFILAATLLCSACEKAFIDDAPSTSPESTFKYLWTRFDEGYSLFDVKGVNWDSIHDVYYPRVLSAYTNQELFDVLGEMIGTLNDGHVNLISDFDVSQSEEVFLQMYGRMNIDYQTIGLTYLGANHHTTGGFQWNYIEDVYTRIAYIYYGSFSNTASTAYLDYILNHETCDGAIIDVRQNGGGNIDNIWEILRLLPGSGQLLYSTQIKAGPAHDDFSEPTAVFAPDNGDYEPFTKPVVILTDRGCYSATSFFALCAKTYPNVLVVGDTTGGGLGLPTGGQLPNGWYYRHSITRTLDADGINYENGVPPDEVVILDPAATAQHRDNVIEHAIQYIKQH